MTLWIAVTSGRPAYQAFRLWLLGGLVTLGMWFHWMPEVATRQLEVSLLTGVLVTLLALTWDAFHFGVYGYLVALLQPRGAWGTLVWPTLWIVLEWVWPHLFPWRMGQSQLGWLPCCQIAEVTGVYGISFLFVWGAAVAAELCCALLLRPTNAKRRSIVWLAVGYGVLLMGNVGWGTWRMRQIESGIASRPALEFALVQPGNRDEQMRDTLRQLSRQVGDGVDLVVWGESSVGDFSLDLKSFRFADEVQAASRGDAGDDQRPCPGLACPLLCGGCSFAPESKQTGPLLNTAFLISADESIVGRYHKRVLMPWGEYAVGQQWIPGLRALLAESDALAAGTSAAPLELPSRAQLGVLICYEDVMPAPARQTVLEGANVLVNLNNLDIFGRTAALRQHQHLARFRAIENRRWLVRCGINGSTAAISDCGRVIKQAPTNKPATLVATVPLCETLTIYTRFGDVFAWLCVAAGSLFLIRAWVGRHGSARPTNQAPAESHSGS
jgi:apolipoprotein N-acyltransferase